ncbi:MAG: L-lactate permease [Gemmataceae bacterium]
MLLAVLYQQQLDPLSGRVFWSPFWSTLLAGLPVIVLFYLLVFRRWLAPWAALGGAVIAVLVAGLVFGMPWDMAGEALLSGAAFGIVPVGWTIFCAMLLYNVSVESGQFRVVRRSVAGLSGDARIQAVLIGFSFGAFLEGAAGGGSPVAICGAILVGLGFNPFLAAVICLIANTSPVAYGGLSTPLLVLSGVTNLDAFSLSQMAGRQLPIMSFIIPMWMVRCICPWKQTFAIWPVLLVAGGSFAGIQMLFAHSPSLFPMTDIAGGILSLIVTACFLSFWKPKEDWHFPKTAKSPAESPRTDNLEQRTPKPVLPHGELPLMDDPDVPVVDLPLTAGRIAKAWMPFALMSVFLLASGLLRQVEGGWVKSAKETARTKGLEDYTQAPLPSWMGMQSLYLIKVPGLHLNSARDPRLQEEGNKGAREEAVFSLALLTSPGTPVFFSAILSMLFLRMSLWQCWRALRVTFWQMRIPIPTIALMIGLSYITRYAGMDGTLGFAFSSTGAMYPFFAAFLGWLGVFLTGTDAGSNALFGSLQKIVADRIHQFTNLTQVQAQILICTTNSTGGVMGKMIDAQSICVATAATNQVGKEADIFKAVVWHSVAMAGLIGLITLLQAYVWPLTLLVPTK